jgi:hypothetical protein
MFSPFQQNYKQEEEKYSSLSSGTFYSSSSKETSSLINEYISTFENKEYNIFYRLCAIHNLLKIPLLNKYDKIYNLLSNLILDENIDIYIRYYIFSNRHPILFFSDELLHSLHLFFFQSFKTNKINVPFDILIHNIKYILSKYGRDCSTRFDALEYIVNKTIDKNISNEELYMCGLTLFEVGENDESQYGKQILQKCKDTSVDINKMLNKIKLKTEDEIMYIVLVKLNNEYMHLLPSQKEIIKSSINSDNKYDVEYFCSLHYFGDIMYDKEYKTILDKNSFDSVYSTAEKLFCKI